MGVYSGFMWFAIVVLWRTLVTTLMNFRYVKDEEFWKYRSNC